MTLFSRRRSLLVTLIVVALVLCLAGAVFAAPPPAPGIHLDAQTGALYPVRNYGGSLKVLTGSFVFSDSYTEGGESFDLTHYFGELLGVVVSTKGGYAFVYDPTAKTVMAYYGGGEAGHTHGLTGTTTDAESAHTHPVALDSGTSGAGSAHSHGAGTLSGTTAAGSAHSHGVTEVVVGNENAHTHAVALDSGTTADESAHTHAVALDGGTTATESAHTHAVALDGGVSDVPSATGAYYINTAVPLAGIQDALTAGATRYIGPADNVENANEDVCFVAPMAGQIVGMYATLGNAPAAGESVTLTARKNGVDQTVVVILSDLETADSDTAHTFDVAAGDKVTVKSVATSNGSFAAADLNVAMIYRITTGTDVIPTTTHTHGPGTLADAASGAGSAHSHGPGTLADTASGGGSAHSHGPGTLADTASGAGSAHTHALAGVTTAEEAAHTHDFTVSAGATGTENAHTHGPGTLADAASGAGSAHSHGMTTAETDEAGSIATEVAARTDLSVLGEITWFAFGW